MDSIEYLNESSINGLNIYAYCRNNPVMYVDPNGNFSLLLGLLIFAGVMTVAGATYGGITAAMNGDNVIKGIGKGMLNGFVIGSGISLVIGGFSVGATTVLGSMMVTYGMGVSSNMIEVAVTQGKKSYYDGDDFWSIAGDINNAMFANSGNILIGKPYLWSIPFYATRMTSKIPAIFSVLSGYDIDNMFGTVSFMASMKETLFGKAGILGIFFGYGITAWQYVKLIKSIFDKPNFEKSNWILY